MGEWRNADLPSARRRVIRNTTAVMRRALSPTRNAAGSIHSCKHFAPEIVVAAAARNHDARHQVSKHNLQEPEIPRKRKRLPSDDGGVLVSAETSKADGPPGAVRPPSR